jgi:hypothetical protein
LKVRAGIPPNAGWLFEAGGAVVCTGAGAGPVSGSDVVAGAVVAGTVGAGVLVVDVDAAVLPVARAPMTATKPPTESSAVATRARAAGCRRCEEGLTGITRLSLLAIVQSHLRAG